MTLDISRYRKLIATLVTLLALRVLGLFGADFSDLAAFGLTSDQVVGGITDWLVTVGLPVFMLWLFPQDTAGQEGLATKVRRNTHLWWFCGAVGVVVAGAGLYAWLV